MEYLHYPPLVAEGEAERLLRGRSQEYMAAVVAWMRPTQVYGQHKLELVGYWKNKEHTKSKGCGERVYIWEEQGDGYDESTLYVILKEFR